MWFRTKRAQRTQPVRPTVRPTLEGRELESRVCLSGRAFSAPVQLPSAIVRHVPTAPKPSPIKIIAPISPAADAEWHDLNGADPNPGNIVGTVNTPLDDLLHQHEPGVRPWTPWFEVTVDKDGNRVAAGPKPTATPPPGTYWGHVQVSPVYTQWARSSDGSIWLRNVADVSADWVLLAQHVSFRVGGAVSGNGPPNGRGVHLPLHDPI